MGTGANFESPWRRSSDSSSTCVIATLAAMVLVMIVAGCAKERTEPAPPAAAAATGTEVSVDTGSDVLPLSTFSLGIAHALPVRTTPQAVPSVPAVKSFVVNVPNVPQSAIKLYWVRDLDLIFSANQQPIAARVEPRSGSGYAVAPPAIPEKGGYLMLVIEPSGGGPNRYYAVALRS